MGGGGFNQPPPQNMAGGDGDEAIIGQLFEQIGSLETKVNSLTKENEDLKKQCE